MRGTGGGAAERRRAASGSPAVPGAIAVAPEAPVAVDEPRLEPDRRTGPVRSVYAHAPFCARRCVYCDFAVQVRRTGGLEPWLEGLEGELRALEAEGRFRLGDSLDTLYVGGGTPSLLGPDAMEGLAGLLGRGRLDAPGLEWTAEANPESFTPDVARAWREAGVTRISLGVQTFHEPALRWMGRLHGPEGAERAVDTIRDTGFRSFSVDLIFGLPEHLGRDWEADLDRILALEPPHVSLYGLTVEPGTRLGRAVAEGREEVAGEDRYGTAYLRAAERFRGAGYRHYEVSNFALPGGGCRHNAVYWDGRPYLGLGNGAHSYLDPLRRWNLRDWDAYWTTAREGRLPVDDREVLDEDARRLERLWLGLRTDRGLDTDGLPTRALDLVYGWCERGWATVDGGVLRLTPLGWLTMDRLVVELDDTLDDDG